MITNNQSITRQLLTVLLALGVLFATTCAGDETPATTTATEPTGLGNWVFFESTNTAGRVEGFGLIADFYSGDEWGRPHSLFVVCRDNLLEILLATNHQIFNGLDNDRSILLYGLEEWERTRTDFHTWWSDEEIESGLFAAEGNRFVDDVSLTANDGALFVEYWHGIISFEVEYWHGISLEEEAGSAIFTLDGLDIVRSRLACI